MMSSSEHVQLDIYNLLGQKVRILVNEEQVPGFYSVVWDGRNGEGQEMASGVYLYRLVTPEYTQSYKMTVLR